MSGSIKTVQIGRPYHLDLSSNISLVAGYDCMFCKQRRRPKGKPWPCRSYGAKILVPPSGSCSMVGPASHIRGTINENSRRGFCSDGPFRHSDIRALGGQANRVYQFWLKSAHHCLFPWALYVCHCIASFQGGACPERPFVCTFLAVSVT